MTGPYAVCGDRWYRTIGDSADRDEGWKGMDDAGGVGEFKWFRVVGGGGSGYQRECRANRQGCMRVYVSTCERTSAGAARVFSTA